MAVTRNLSSHGAGSYSHPSGSYGTSALDSLVNSLTGAGLTGAEQEANEFTATQANLAREWQEEMYNKYQSPAAMARQYSEAGLNPALMYESGAGSPSFNSASSPSSVNPGNAQIASLFSLLSSAVTLRNQTRLAQADVDLKSSQSALNRQNAEESEHRISLIDANAALSRMNLKSVETGIDLTLAEINSIDVQNRLSEARISTEEAVSALTWYKALLASSDAAHRDDVLDAQISLLKAQERLTRAESSLADARSRESAAEVERLEAEVEYLTQQVDQRSKSFEHELHILEVSSDYAEKSTRVKNFSEGARAIGSVLTGVAAGAAAGYNLTKIPKKPSPEIVEHGTMSFF